MKRFTGVNLVSFFKVLDPKYRYRRLKDTVYGPKYGAQALSKLNKPSSTMIFKLIYLWPSRAISETRPLIELV